MLRLVGGMRAPDRLEERAVREHASRVLGEIGQQLKLFRRQTHFFAVSQHAKTVAVDDECSTNDGTTSRRGAVRAPKRSANPRQQFSPSRTAW